MVQIKQYGINVCNFHHNICKMSTCNVCETNKAGKQCMKCMIKMHNKLEKYIKDNFKDRQEFLNKIDSVRRHEYLKYILELQEKHGPSTHRYKWYDPILTCIL